MNCFVALEKKLKKIVIMKTIAILRKATAMLFALVLVLTYSCDSGIDIDDTDYPDALIIHELPKLTIMGKHLESVVINSQQELESVFNDTELQREESLAAIDFSKYTLLLGYGTYSNEVSTMEHYYAKIGKGSYRYLIEISGLATQPDAFRYGVIVPKLPKTAKVTFEIEKL